jgi:serine/threonine protein phosphatase PrpC
LSFVQYQCLTIHYARRLIFATDGLLPLADEMPTIFLNSLPQQVMTTACDLEKRLGETDDKTLVILDRRA